MLSVLLETFKSKFKEKPIIVRAPGRINLIGEHTDYNMGFVMPAAVDKEILFIIAPNGSNVSRIYSYDYNQEVTVENTNFSKHSFGWVDYLTGVIEVLKSNGYTTSGVNCVFGGSIPLGAGMSSSAALECGFIFALNEIFQFDIPKLVMVKMAQKAENVYVGVNCGIMDQFASMMSKQDTFIQLDCKSLEYEYAKSDWSRYSIVLVNSMVKHSLASSAYNTRRLECEQGVNFLKTRYKSISSLRDVNVNQLHEVQYLMDPEIYSRCLYVVQENNRVETVKDILQNQSVIAIKKHINGSHNGLKIKYKVSCPELDFLAESAASFDYVYGSRMMGGGFGGCTLNIVTKSAVEDFKTKIADLYKEQFSILPEIYETNTVDGVSQV